MEPDWLDKTLTEALTPHPASYRQRWVARFRTDILTHPWLMGGLCGGMLLGNVFLGHPTVWQAVVGRVIQSVVGQSLGLALGVTIHLWWHEHKQGCMQRIRYVAKRCWNSPLLIVWLLIALLWMGGKRCWNSPLLIVWLLIALLWMGGTLVHQQQTISRYSAIIDFAKAEEEQVRGDATRLGLVPPQQVRDRENAAFWYGMQLQTRLVLCAMPPRPVITLDRVHAQSMWELYVQGQPLPDCTTLQALQAPAPN